MVTKNWSELSHDCPIGISRIESYAKEFETLLPQKITKETLDASKERVLRARGSFDSMITSLVQILYDREVLKNSEDKILFAWLVDNFGRYLKRVDDKEFDFLIKDDTAEGKDVGISKVSTYSNFLRTSSDSLIYESLLKATKEWVEMEETKEIKRDKRTFLYILFQILQVTLSILGGLTREKIGIGKRGVVQNIPTSWQSLMGKSGQELIKEGYKEDTGIDVSKFEEDLKALEIEGDLEDESNIESD